MLVLLSTISCTSLRFANIKTATVWGSIGFLFIIPLIRARCASLVRAIGAGHLTVGSYSAIVHGIPPDATAAELVAHLEPFATVPQVASDAMGPGGGRADGVARVWIARRERQVCP